MLISFTPFHEIWQAPVQPLNFIRNSHKKCRRRQTVSILSGLPPFTPRAENFTSHKANSIQHQLGMIIGKAEENGRHKRRVAGGWLTKLSSVHPNWGVICYWARKKLTSLPGCHKYIPQHRQTINNLCDLRVDEWPTWEGGAGWRCRSGWCGVNWWWGWQDGTLLNCSITGAHVKHELWIVIEIDVVVAADALKINVYTFEWKWFSVRKYS